MRSLFSKNLQMFKYIAARCICMPKFCGERMGSCSVVFVVGDFVMLGVKT